MKEYLKHNILNVEIQREDEKRLHVSPLFYGAYNNALNGTLIYSEEGLTIHFKEENLKVGYEELDYVELSFIFKRTSYRGLPENACYIDVYLKCKDQRSYEFCTLSHKEVVDLYEMLKNKDITIHDLMKVIKTLEKFENIEDGFYSFVRTHGKEVADKYGLMYPKIDNTRTK